MILRRSPRTLLVGLLLVLGAGACTSLGPAPAAPALSAQRIAEIVASPGRSAADKTNDLRRKPEPMLAFIGLQPGMVALDVSAAGGYTTELLARAIGPAGRVYGQSPPRDPNRAPPAAPEGNSAPHLAPMPAPMPVAAPRPGLPRTSATALAERRERLERDKVAAAPIQAVEQPFDDPAPAALAVGGLDLVTLMFNYHDLGHMGVDRDRMNRALFRALKPGGLYVIADHSGRPGTGISEAGTLHRIEEAFLRREVEAAGFRLAAEAGFLRNPGDPRDRNTPDPPQPKDEFVLKFVKP
jgi:predicted methyltransferase